MTLASSSSSVAATLAAMLAVSSAVSAVAGLLPDGGEREPHGSPSSSSGDLLLAEEENAALWDRLLRGPSPLGGPSSSEDFGDLLARQMEAQRSSEPRFPALTKSQARFAVNPGYQEFFDPQFRPNERLAAQEGVSPMGEELESGGEEPVHHHGRDSFPKKASLRDSLFGLREAIEQQRMDDIYFTTIVAVSSALAVFAIVGAGFCYHRVRRNSKASEDVDYPAYGVTGPGGKDGGGHHLPGGGATSGGISPTSGADRKLAQNAQLYHYQHQKQQMIAFDTASGDGRGRSGVNGGGAANGASDCESDDGEEGDYTVYECPGLAPAGEMEVHNPLFQGDTTPKASK